MPRQPMYLPSDRWSRPRTELPARELIAAARFVPIAAKQLSEMVDSSLRVADKVIQDNQSIKGERQVYRYAHWEYLPLEVEIAYHQVDDLVEVLYFRYRLCWPERHSDGVGWKTIPTTGAYRGLLYEADRTRKHIP